MSHHPIPASFAPDESVVATGAAGQLAHAAMFDHMTRLEERLYAVSDGVWCMVGNGLSNQTFVEGPEGLIVIDTGESNEEMAAALAAVRAHTDAPVAAVIYTHFHYCMGTAALLGDKVGDPAELPIWGHVGIEGNLARMAVERRVFPLMEVENGGSWRFTVDHPGGPVEEYIRRQARFKHLTDRQVEIIQDEVDARWEILSNRVKYGT